MDVPESLLTEQGPPDSISGDWATWKHNCGAGSYATLLYSFKSGWAFCKGCSFKRFYLSKQRRAHVVIGRIGTPRLALEDVSGIRHEYLRYRGVRTTEEGFFGERFTDKAYVYIPIVEDGLMVSYQKRHLLKVQHEQYRYVGAPISEGWMGQSECVWGLDRIVPMEPVYICEGVFDALYFPTGVAVLGRELNEAKVVKILDRQPSKVVLCPDERSDIQLARWMKEVRKQDSHVPVEIRCASLLGLKDFGDLVKRGERHGE
ncbi:MAG: hypothetical protein ACXABY_09820 [Candidatus Thorarchaeota archaeon]|jgi:hypothetical protein